ncbi:MAG: hypothetical protein DRI69_00040 [Bacteroidetes bacterium]|nr:MAG: hypothetical protein DRI69_00040 [Bacteroidota bacterium]
MSQVDGFSMEADTIENAYDDDVPTVEGPKANMFEGPPGRAALYSLIIPGTGQIYNGSYWKAPIVWGLIGTMGTLVAFTSNQYRELDTRYVNALTDEMSANPGTDPDPYGLSSTQLFNLRTEANKNRQLSIVIFSFAWLGQTIEAYVDGHLKEFDVSDDLSIRFKPIMFNDGASIAQTGITIRF